MADTHALMSSKLAKALMEAGVHHFDSGGIAGVPGALTVQNGYNAGMAPQASTNYGPNIAQSYGNANAGYANSQDIQAQQQALANALLVQSQGGGPNPAQAALAQQTGQNVAQQGALMASQRGSSANAGLLAEQAARQGGAIQQNSVGQGATLQAQQQLAAQNELAKQQAQMQSGNIAEQGVNAQLYGTSAGAQNTQNANNIQNMAMSQGINSQINQNNANAVNKTQEGMLKGGASSLPVIGQIAGSMFSKGGQVSSHIENIARIYHPNKFSTGGDVGSVANIPSAPNLSNASAVAADYQASADKKKDSGSKVIPSSPADLNPMQTSSPVGSAGASDLPELIEAGAVAASKGIKVPGKAKVKGNSVKNDTQLALVSPGEDIIPRSITQGPNAPEKAAEFVRHLQEKKKGEKEEPKGFEKIIQSKKSLKDRMEALEKYCYGGMS